jgi:trigger factor
MSRLEAVDEKSVKLFFDIDSQNFNDAIKFVYNKKKNRINIPGFRKGKAPLQIIENYYGKDFFYNDALNHILPEEFEKALSEHTIDTVGYPEFDLENISDDKVVSMVATLTLHPKAQVSEYKNLPYVPFDTNVTEEEVNKKLEAERKKNVRLINVDRPIENEDIVNINFEGFIDNVPFEGGKGENYDLKIGSHSFIDTFEEQLIGKNMDDEVEVNVTFPENYHQADFANKPALFKVKINKISVEELPKLDDDFAQDVSEFDTLDEYKKDILEKMKEEKLNQAKHDKENQVTQALINNTTVEIPQVMIDNAARNMLRGFEQDLSSQGLSFDTYLQYMGQTRASMLKMYESNAQKQLKIRLALEAIAQSENLEATEDEINAEIDKIVEQTKLEKEKILSLLNNEEKENIKKDIIVKKALDIVLENAVESSQPQENQESDK